MTTEELAGLTYDRARFADHVYTPLEAAVKTLRARRPRWRAPAAGTTPDGATVPAVLQQERPTAVLFRQVGSPNYEMRRVIRLAAQHDLALVVFEYHADRFMTRNYCKYALGRLGFYSGLGRHGGRRIDYVPIIDLNADNGRPFSALRTFRGEPFIDFHHGLLAVECPSLGPGALFDASAWFANHGATARHYYPAFLSLFLRHAILFETFNLTGDEGNFTRDVVLRSFEALRARHGVKPLIVPAEQEDWEGDDFWQLYPEALRVHVGPYRVRDRVADETGIQWETPAQREPPPLAAAAASATASAPIARPLFSRS